MAASKKLTGSQKVTYTLIGLLLIVGGIFLYLKITSTPPLPIRESIEQALQKQTTLDPRRKELVRVQLALNDYQLRNAGQLPQDLNVLIPTYFDQIPLDPETGKPFDYKIDKGRAIVGGDVPFATRPKPAKPKPKTLEEITKEEEQILIASIGKPIEGADILYDPTGKRDPFKPFDFSPTPPAGATALERYDLGQLKLTAVLGGMDEPTAVVENSVGKGFTVRRGTKIGLNGGEVIEVFPDKLVILETRTDFTGQERNRRVEMPLRTKAEEKGPPQRENR